MQAKKEINVEIGRNIKRAREEAGLTQERLSEMMGMGVKSLSAIECGTVGISLSALKRVCEILRVPAATLIFGQTDADTSERIAESIKRMSPVETRFVEGILEKLNELMRNRDFPE